MNSTTVILLGVASYLVGSIPNGLILARIKGVDIRKVGSGNIGATNVFRSVGKAWGIATFVGDLLKGLMPALFFPMIENPRSAWTGVLFGCLAIAGHNWPIFLHFKGGKGVATSAGVLLGVAPAALGIGLLCWIVLFVSSRYVSVASIGAAAVVPIAGWFRYRQDGPLLPVTLSLLGLVVVWRHRGNIQRLLTGTEHRFDFKKRVS